MSKKLNEGTRDLLSRRLIVLGDFLAEDDEHGSFRREVGKEYKQILNKLYPKPRPKMRQIKPVCENCGKSQTNRIRTHIKTVRFNCSCGHITTITIEETKKEEA